MPSLTLKPLLAVAWLALAASAQAQDAPFAASDYGSAQLVLRQNVGDAARFIAASDGGAFEPIGELGPADRMAVLARPVGRVDVLLRDRQTGEEGASACTGALLGDGLVLTNHHCLPQEGPVEVVAASILMDYLALDGAGSERFEVDPVPLEWNPDLDFAVARVAGAPSERFGRVALGPVAEGLGAARTVIHHPLGKPKVMSRFRCLVLADRSRGPVVAHRCDTLPGSSGSLLFDERGVAVALHRAGGLDPADATSFNMAIDLGTILGASETLARSPAADAGVGAGAGPADAPAAGDDGVSDGGGGLGVDRMNDILRGN